MSPGFQFVDAQAGVGKSLSSLRSGDQKLSQRFSPVNKLKVLDEVILVEVRRQRLTLPRHGLDPQRLFVGKHKDVSEKSSFDIAKKRFTTKASLQSLDIVRAEAVKERPAVWTCHSKLRSVRNVEDRSGFRSGSIFRLGVSEVGLRMSWLHAVVSKSIINGCSCGHGSGTVLHHTSGIKPAGALPTAGWAVPTLQLSWQGDVLIH